MEAVRLTNSEHDQIARAIVALPLTKNRIDKWVRCIVRLFHFSEDSAIDEFVPRSMLVAPQRPPGSEWLNDPLVWAIDEVHQKLYCFPRDCPRIVIWATPHTSAFDLQHWLGGREGSSAAYIEKSWFESLRHTPIVRYELPASTFESIRDAGMWVSRASVRPIGRVWLTDLPARLEEFGTELRVVESLVPLRLLWNTSLHTSGIRLRNARGWDDAPGDSTQT